MAQAIGTFGTVAVASTGGVEGVLVSVAAAKIGFLDNDAALDGALNPNEAIVLSIDGSATVKVGDILLDPGTGLTGAAGSTITSAPAGTLDYTIGATALQDLLFFVDTLPTYANGGPDGAFNPGEPLFFDIDSSSSPNSGDRLLVSGTGVTGTVGGIVSTTQSESVWDPANECVYQTAGSAVAVGDRRVTDCATYLSGSAVESGDTDIASTLVAISGLVMSFPASRTVTDGVTTITDQTVTSATAAFVAGDVGSTISGTGIPTGSWITSINSGTSVEISAAATASGTGVSITINPTGARTVLDGATTSGDATVTSATAAFSATDVGRTISGTGIPSGATIKDFTNSQSVEISAVATATGSGLSLSLGSAAALFHDGEDAWVGSSTVISGHYRLTGTPGTVAQCGSFGADADCATTTVALSNGKVTVASVPYTFPVGGISYFDASGNGMGPDGTDQVLLDVDLDGFMTPPDVRLNTAGSQTLGARPTVSASSPTHAVLNIGPFTPKFLWLDTTTNVGQVDTTEVLAISVDGDTVVDIGDICLTAVGSCAAGAQRTGATTTPTVGGTWKDVATASNVGALGYLDPNANTKYDRADSLYLHFGAALPSAGTAGDLLIASDTGGSGTRVTTSPGSLKAFSGTYNALDVDGNGAFGVGDILVIENGIGTANAAEPGEVRLNSATGLSGFGKNIKEGDAESVPTLMNIATPTFSFRDEDTSSGQSVNDPFFLMQHATCPLVGSDVVMAKGTSSGWTSGNFVGVATSNTCTVVAGPEFAFIPAGAYSTSSLMYLDINGDGTLAIGDIRVSSGITQGAAGTRIGGGGTSTADTGAATSITLGAPVDGNHAGNVQVAFHDASGDGVAAALETVILDIDGDSFFTPGDVVLSTSAVTTTTSGGGGGGGTGVTTTTTSTDTTTSSSTDSASSTNSSTSSSTSTTSDPGETDIAAANLAIAASLEVKRKDGENVLTWDTQPGVDGYQVFSADSPFVLVTTLEGQDQSTYTDPNGDKDTKYLVTAYLAGDELTADDVNNGDVPGYSEVPEGEDAKKGGKGFIPAPGFLLVTLALAALALVLRRRLE